MKGVTEETWNPEKEVFHTSCEAADGFKRVCMWVCFNFLSGKPREITSLSFSFKRKAWQNCSQNPISAKLKIAESSASGGSTTTTTSRQVTNLNRSQINTRYTNPYLVCFKKLYLMYCAVNAQNIKNTVEFNASLHKWMDIQQTWLTAGKIPLVMGGTAFLIMFVLICTQFLYIQQTSYMFTLFQGFSTDLYCSVWLHGGKRGLTFKGLCLLLCVIRIIWRVTVKNEPFLSSCCDMEAAFVSTVNSDVFISH